MNGLHYSIANGIRMFQPRSLREVINYARLMEGQLHRQKKMTSSSPMVRNLNYNRTTPRRETEELTPKKLSWEELKKKRSLGLCFSCDERYTPGHKCKQPQLFIMEGEQDVEVETEEEKEGEQKPEITMYALAGWDTVNTIRVHASIRKKKLIALIDSVSIHNFISAKAAQTLNLSATPTSLFHVRVANGTPLVYRSRFDSVPIMMGGEVFPVTLYTVPLVGLDLVMGVQWLEGLGPTLCDWKAHTMKFKWAGKEVTLRGVDSSQLQAIKPTKIKKEARQGQSIFAISVAQPTDEITPVPEKMQGLLTVFNDLFATPNQLPPKREIQHHITLKEGADPVNVRPYRYAYYQKDEIERQVQEMLRAGIIRPSSSPFSSPVLLVKKKDGSWRFCTDYRALNAVTIKDRFPIPTVDDMLDELHGAQFFTKLDLTAGYHQVRMHTPDIHKTAFRTHNGHYEYLVMPFGLCNAPSTFQALMNEVFRPLLRKSVLVFFDDILIYSASWLEHLQHVREVLTLLRQHKLAVKHKKCEFGQEELEYLGHIISRAGVKVDRAKIAAMLDWPQPTTITELRGFLGLTGYYRKFVRDYGLIARPLTNLLRKGTFAWSEIATEAFSKLKQALTTTPTLALPDFSLPFVIQTDASGEGICAVLSQNEKPIAFMSRTLGVSKQSWSTYAREMLAIVVAIRTWKPYIIGRRFIIQTDQRSLRYLLEQQKWMGKLAGYDYEIVYKPGNTNLVADALSRVHGSPTLDAIFVPQSSLWEDIKVLIQTDPYLQRIGHLATAKPGQPYEWRDGLIYYRNRVVVPPSSPLILQLIREHHDTPMGGHSGVLRTFRRLARQYYWPSMHKVVREYVAACSICQKAKYSSLSPAGLLQPLPVPSQVWEDISMDFVVGLPRSKGHDSLMVVVDRLTKSAHLIPLSHPYTAKTVAAKFVSHVVKLHGIPRSIVSDRDPLFMSLFWQEFWILAGTKLRMSTAYHPQTDGQTEVVNRCIEQFLRCFVHHHPNQWSSFIPWAEYWYNTTFHASTGTTPFQALYGRPPPPIPAYEVGSALNGELDEQLAERDELLLELKQHLATANSRMKQVADSKRRELTFQIGDWVLLRIQPYRQKTLFRRSSQKLSHRYYGPFQIEAKHGEVAYRLSLPPRYTDTPCFSRFLT